PVHQHQCRAAWYRREQGVFIIKAGYLQERLFLKADGIGIEREGLLQITDTDTDSRQEGVGDAGHTHYFNQIVIRVAAEADQGAVIFRQCRRRSGYTATGTLEAAGKGSGIMRVEHQLAGVLLVVPADPVSELHQQNMGAAAIGRFHDHFDTVIARQSLDFARSEEHTSELQSRENLVCRLLLETKKLASPEH